ncbi:hypothetical protein EI42_00840 [Thermosporothrix hazakensis]|jgi:hypothetical protein|uniref:Uncharacterized protein n=1 Tax=Thermosporothrix hazakensis TaxID=644383 RepID=A0A326UIU9_THEHA|nr:DUF5522 domain-containing protein [Thermosporothrix hazakensis]PZW36660.1 hypothetical protein EI42_00840 [Thermosporothrix hazakensis]GCE47310.1 hypothetical protein KTH_21790 [Thermosporothrix hazakensis]
MEANLKRKLQNENADWEITSDGLYVATRGFLIRRGYCCANRCKNCPYINWRDNPKWEPAPPEAVRQMRVSPKAIAGAEAMLAYHRQQLELAHDEQEQRYHRRMWTHYAHLLRCWGAGS